MKRAILVGIFVPLFAGCLSKAPRSPDNWLIEFDRASDAALPAGDVARPSLRLASVEVRPPYNGQRLAVLRPDGSVAFDAFNAFAAPPAQLLRGAVFDAVTASGRFLPLGERANVRTAAGFDVAVSRLAFDCRKGGRGEALVELALTVGDGHGPSAVSRGRASVPVEGGDLSAAFSKSFRFAFDEAFARVPDIGR